MVQIANISNFICDHYNFCHPNCYERQRRSCTRLMTAVRKCYQSEEGDAKIEEEEAEKREENKRDTFRNKLKRRVSYDIAYFEFLIKGQLHVFFSVLYQYCLNN